MKFNSAAKTESYKLPQLNSSFESSAAASPSYFLCSFDGELLVDPVSVSCGHTFERKLIEDFLRLGTYRCPECNKELSPTEKLTPNTALRIFILENKQRNAVMKLRLASSLLLLDNLESVNLALVDLYDAMIEIPGCIAKAKEDKVISALAIFLKNSFGDIRAVLCCLLLIARFSDENKETMGKTGVIKCLTKLLLGPEPEPYALEILLELSKKKSVADKIGKETNSIPILVSLLNYPTDDIVQKARGVLGNLSTIECTITMAKCGYFVPFIESFCRSEKMRALMANELAQVKLTEVDVRSLGNDKFITCLIELVECNLPSSKLAFFQCIKQLISFSEFQLQFLSNELTIPALLSVINRAEEQEWKQEVVQILVHLIQINQITDYQNYPGLMILYNSYTIKTLLLQIETSSNHDQILLLKLLNLILQKSDSALKWIKSTDSWIEFLFSALKRDQTDCVRLQILKLIHYITGTNPDDNFSLPPFPARTSFVNFIIHILTNSCVEEERCSAAGIIGYLPTGDHELDELLKNSSFLKAINDIFSRNINSIELIENSLAALQRYLKISNYVLCKKSSKLHQHLVQMLSNGFSPLIKQRSAMALSSLACNEIIPSTSANSKFSFAKVKQRIPNMIQSKPCPLHLCSSLQNSVCLIKTGAVKPLVEMVKSLETETCAAALKTLNTVCVHCDLSVSADLIVESGGSVAIIEVLEKGPICVKKDALELLEKICKCQRIRADGLENKFDRVLLYMLCNDSQNKAKVASVRAKLGLFHGPS